MPVYRHPSDESPPLLPFSPTVLAIRNEIERHLGHPLNHVLIQHYRSGNDYISEHSDKTLDIVPGSFIANVSLGAERTMVFRTKRPDHKHRSPTKTTPPSMSQVETSAAADPSSDGTAAASRDPDPDPAKARRQIQRAPLPHNSLCRMGLATNMRWLHAIRQDKRSERDKTEAERARGGARISLTFRHIGTFIDAAQTRIWGQGAPAKTKQAAAAADHPAVVNGQTPEAVRMVQAFGTENNSSAFDWAAHYGAGFNVLHMGTPKRLCAGPDAVANARVALALAGLGISCAKGSVDADVRFEDNNSGPAGRAVVEGHATVLRYLDAVYGPGRRFDQMTAAEVARRFGLLQLALDALPAWRAVRAKCREREEAVPDAKDREGYLGKVVRREVLEGWEGRCADAASLAGKPDEEEKRLGEDAAGGMATTTTTTTTMVYIAGGEAPSPADFALWPVLDEIVRVCGEGDDVLSIKDGWLKRYYEGFKGRSAVAKVLGGGGERGK